MALPYAPFPKYGPAVLGQAKYDAELRAWEAYQASLRNTASDPPMAPAAVEGEDPGENLDTFTYTRKYVKHGQTRKRIFREQGIRATDPEQAKTQGRHAMEAELGPRWTDNGRGADGGAEIHWYPVPGSEKVAKPRGKAFEQGEDDRRNDEGTNGSSETQSTGEARPDAMPPDETPGQEQNQGSGGEQGDGNESSQNAGDADGQGGQDDTPRMPTCPECGMPRGMTEGCCAPEQPGQLPKPDQGPPDTSNLQLLRTDGEAPYMGDEATLKLHRVSHMETVATLAKALADVDTWTRGVVKHDVHALATEIYEAMSKSHVDLTQKISKARSNGAGLDMGAVMGIVTKALADFNVNFKPPEQKPVNTDDLALTVADLVADLVAEKLNQPRRIEVSLNGKVQEIKGTPHGAFDESLRAMTRGLDLFMVGPAGSGKGFLAQHLADALGQRFGFLSCSEGMSEGMLLGRGVPLADRFLYLQSSFVDFYENGGVFLLDEIDAANPNVLLIINECLSSPHLSIPNRVDDPYAVRHADFYAIVAANTWGTGPDMEYVGRNRLDAAFLNRFIGSQIELGYDAKIEGQIAKAYMGPKKAEDVLKRFWGVRKKLVDLNIRRIWSTRGLEKMCIALAAGDEMSAVLDAHTRGWTKDEKSKAGVEA